jgi:hypothetical protein
MSAFAVGRRAADGAESVAAEAVIAQARRRQRRRRFAVVAIASALAAAYVAFGHPGIRSGGGAGTASQVSSPARVAACLQRHSILVSRAPSSRDFGFVRAMRISFALVPGQRHDAGYLFFERSPSEANGVVATLVRRFETKAPIVRSYFTVGGSVVALWDSSHPSAAARATLQGCL